ncbi:MAG: sugar transferase, partial [Steroidobacteraceae bacterium]
MSTPRANETSQQHAGAVQVPLRRPHLVSTTELRLQSETVVATGMEAQAPVELARGGCSFPENSARTSVARCAAPAAPAWGKAAGKRLVDVVGAMILGLVFAPLIVIIVLLLRKGGGAVIYPHRRVGRGGRMFACLKFRTMVPNADQVL